MNSMKPTRFAGALAALLMALACAPVNQTITLAPRLEPTPSEIGKGVRVVLRVVDARADQSRLGTLTHADEREAAVMGEPSLVEVIREQAFAGLKAKGFDAVEPGPEAPVALTIEIVEFNYSGKTSMVSSTVRTTVVLRAKAGRFDAKYEKSYRVENEQGVSFVPTSDENAEIINEALSKTLGALLSDEKLLGFLAKGPEAAETEEAAK